MKPQEPKQPPTIWMIHVPTGEPVVWTKSRSKRRAIDIIVEAHGIKWHTLYGRGWRCYQYELRRVEK